MAEAWILPAGFDQRLHVIDQRVGGMDGGDGLLQGW